MPPETYQRFSAVQRLPLTPAMISRWRKQRGLGQGTFGKLFKSKDDPNGYTRGYISRLERGKFPITKKFSERFEEVRDKWRESKQETARESGPIEIFSKRHVPRRLHIIRPVVKCSRCGIYFEQVNGRHRRCHTPECDAKKKRRRSKKQK